MQYDVFMHLIYILVKYEFLCFSIIPVMVLKYIFSEVVDVVLLVSIGSMQTMFLVEGNLISYSILILGCKYHCMLHTAHSQKIFPCYISFMGNSSQLLSNHRLYIKMDVAGCDVHPLVCTGAGLEAGIFWIQHLAAVVGIVL